MSTRSGGRGELRWEKHHLRDELEPQYQIKLCLYNVVGAWLDPTPVSIETLARKHPEALAELVAKLSKYRKESSPEQLSFHTE